MKRKTPWLYTTKAHIIMYGMLLIFTPFLMLRNYLQSSIGKLSRLSFTLGGKEIPYVLITLILSLIIIALLNYRKIKLSLFFAGIACILLIALAQLFTDYYFDHRFYDLQHNWHYFAYGIYSYIAFRYFANRGNPIERIVLFIFLSAIALSSFDEGVQVFISNRIFDISDIAKDSWGAVIGTIFLFFGIFPDKIKDFKPVIRHKKITSYLSNPKTVVFWELILSFILINVSSLLANIRYWYYIIIITLFIFLVVFFLVHLTQRKTGRIIIICAISSLILLQTISFIKHKDDSIVQNKCGLINYRGIPIPFFDIMIFPNDTFRLVDKKEFFNGRDLSTIYARVDDILLIGSGFDDGSIKGFPEDQSVQFVFNHIKNKGLQVVIQPTAEACKTFNRLKREGKNVLFIIHNSC
ncbi:VanZ family protein [Candidatus Cloacimonadota bacterium]